MCGGPMSPSACAFPHVLDCCVLRWLSSHYLYVQHVHTTLLHQERYGISGIPADGCDETRDMVHWSCAVLHETITWKSAGGNELCPFRCWSGANADSFSRAVF